MPGLVPQGARLRQLLRGKDEGEPASYGVVRDEEVLAEVRGTLLEQDQGEGQDFWREELLNTGTALHATNRPNVA